MITQIFQFQRPSKHILTINKLLKRPNQNLVLLISTLNTDFDEAENNMVLNGGVSFFLSRLPSELGTFLALIGGALHNDELRVLNLVGRQIAYTDRENMSSFASKLEMCQDFFTASDLMLDEGTLLIDKKKDNERVLRETLDRMRDSDGRKVMLDAYYRKRLTDFVNVTAESRTDFNKKLTVDQMKFQMIENNNLLFEGFLADDLAVKDTPNSSDYGPVYLRKSHILDLFAGETLEDIYERLDKDKSAFANRCKIVLKSRDQNVLRSNLFLIRQANNSSMAESIHREYKVANLLVNNSATFTPKLFERCLSANQATNELFLDQNVEPGPDLGGETHID